MNAPDSKGRIDTITMEAVLCQLLAVTQYCQSPTLLSFYLPYFGGFFSPCLSLDWLLDEMMVVTVSNSAFQKQDLLGNHSRAKELNLPIAPGNVAWRKQETQGIFTYSLH